uniref:Secreted protein n=1 Tax=Schistosoma curassoni TaxID=6186 RepID=A0A183KB42_9TREM
MWSIPAVTATSAFSASAGILSGPDALPLLICLMAMLISSIVDGPTSAEKSVSAASMLSRFSGAGSTYLFCCSSVLVITLSSLLFTGRSGLR